MPAGETVAYACCLANLAGADQIDNPRMFECVSQFGKEVARQVWIRPAWPFLMTPLTGISSAASPNCYYRDYENTNSYSLEASLEVGRPLGCSGRQNRFRRDPVSR